MRRYLLPETGSFYKANLHAHSTVSDGGLTPSELKERYRAKGYSILALTDHETDGGTKEFQYTANQEGIQTIVGAEFTGMEGDYWLHLTALDYDYNDPGLRALVKRLCDDMTEYTRKRFQRALENGWRASPGMISCPPWVPTPGSATIPCRTS